MSFVNFMLCGLITVALVKSTEGHQECHTPSGSKGHCVEFKSCSTFYEMGEQLWLTPEDLIVLNQSWCGTNNVGVRTICCSIGSMNEIKKLHPISHAELLTPITDLSKHPNANLLPIQSCGISSVDKIANGNLTEPFEFPWMAMLRTISSGNKLTVLCGGTLISKRYVLTAAHCLRSAQGEIKIHSVVLGEHDTNTSPDCIDDECADPIQEISVERSIPHPKFSSASAKNDVGLVRLQWNAQFSGSVSPICIPYTQESQASNYKKVIVSGWGGTEHGPTSNVLLKAVLDILPNSECTTIFLRHNYNRIQINANFMCGFGGDSDTCSGDSGGPAIYLGPTLRLGPRMFQYGIVSAGARTCGQNNGIPGLYTRVTRYAQWILDNITE